ncbi:unnamed protein product [Closterium sp. Naga37s-1]|nr:unnamed protein product [Closterium sp. Naga37s-1]
MLRRFRFARLGSLPIQPHAALSRLFPLRNAPLTFLHALPREPPRACPSDARPRHLTVVAGRRNHGGGAMKQRPKDWRPQSTPFHARNRSPRRNDRAVPLGPRGGNEGDGGDGSAESAGRMQRDVADLGADWRLGPGEAVGRVMSAQANFVRVIVTRCGVEDEREGSEERGEEPGRSNNGQSHQGGQREIPREAPRGTAEVAGMGIRTDHPTPLFSLLMHGTLPSVQVGERRRQGAQRSSNWGGRQCNGHSNRPPTPPLCLSAYACVPPICAGGGGETPRGAAEQRRQGEGAEGREGKDGTERRDGREEEKGGRQGREEEREGVELLCVVRALLKKLRRRVLVGDVVRLGGIDWAARQAVVQDVALPRASEILDPPVANADHLLLLFSLAQPPPEPSNVSRFLVAAEATGVAVSLVFNKADLVDEEAVQEWQQRAAEWGYQMLTCSVERRIGIRHLAGPGGLLAGRTTVIAGPSGVGKSSLINAVLGEAYNGDAHNKEVCDADGLKEGGEGEGGEAKFEELRVGEVSKRSGRGRHTTRHVALVKIPDVTVEGDSAVTIPDVTIGGMSAMVHDVTIEGDTREAVGGVRVQEEDAVCDHSSSASNSRSSDRTNSNSSTSSDLSSSSSDLSSSSSSSSSGGLLADSPGFSQPSLANVTCSDLPMLFPEIRTRLATSPTSCAFADCRHISEPGCAVDSGWERYRHYVMLMDEIRVREAAEIRAVGTKREGDVRLKSGGYGVVVAEPRLEAKKHRRESRKKGKQLLLQQLAVEEEEDEEEERLGFAGGYEGSERRR